ncbi:putative transcription factor MYB family [Helianthus annuus]|uniref:Putative MADF domain, Myb-like domain protein n=1 Tax=Helianthus annuus TaxID=4232 RepID=A0A251VBW6_HELAN|nr:trihelix transcription factor ASIL2 [Helianthus annuus]KAF5816302.1 putative transcription factor MYB family [Helianthus annuus]KAJ0775441.1 putative transcription factor MYB family [Helianthus annuus]KAJ0937627.1 putative transcription factor MYB family [Helianthus annuus]KAJ0945568.1 putative transcription factor MYB family [Helianthus annuus]
MSSTGQKTVRKFPPPCWTRDEALVLIEAYRERWHALHRAFLRTPDWDAVAETVTSSCPDVTPPKTSAQCRHKMEKLRQRHRAEKQRASAFPGERFFSTWFYYEAMEAMENGPGSSSEPGNNPDPGQGIQVKPLAVQKFATLAPISTKQRTKPNPNPNFNSGTSNRYNSYPNYNSNNVDDYAQRSVSEAPIEEPLISSAYRGRETLIREAKNHKKPSIGGGVRSKSANTPIPPHEESGRPGLRPRKFSKVVHDHDDGDDDDDDDEMWVKVPRSTNVLRGKWRNENNSSSNGKNVNGKNGKKGKRKDGGVAEVVSSIRLLGEGFMKVEKMKMDMAREIEEMRMETEMKRNELMIESQKQIVDAFVQGLVKSRKVKAATMVNL